MNNSDNEINASDINNYNCKVNREILKWNISNTENIVNWISHCNLNILLLNSYLTSLKNILRINTLWSLVISSVTSTISVTQFTISDVSEPSLSLAIKIAIFITSIFTSLLTGYIKVEKIQENIEIIEEHKSKWSNLMFSLLSEIQVPIDLRNPADKIIIEKREEFNLISSKNLEIPSSVREQVSKFLIENRYNEKTKNNISWYMRLSNCCKLSHYYKINVSSTKRKLSLFNNVNLMLEKEILSLLLYYPEDIDKIKFDKNSDMLKFEIISKDFKFHKNILDEKGLNGKTIVEFGPQNDNVKKFKNLAIQGAIQYNRQSIYQTAPPNNSYQNIQSSYQRNPYQTRYQTYNYNSNNNIPSPRSFQPIPNTQQDPESINVPIPIIRSVTPSRQAKNTINETNNNENITKENFETEQSKSNSPKNKEIESDSD